MDYISILDGRIPAYYEAVECENNNMIFSYWFFYGYKDDCPMLPGDPGDDVNWGRYVVKVIKSPVWKGVMLRNWSRSISI